MTQEELEKSVMNKLLFGDTKLLESLRKQYEASKIISREFTQHGFCADFEVPESLKLDKDISFHIGDILGVNEKDRDKNLDFILWIKNGIISYLEGTVFGVEVSWDKNYDDIKLVYHTNGERDLSKIKEIEKTLNK